MVLWADYFKPEHISRNTQTCTINSGKQLNKQSECKHHLEPVEGQKLLDQVDEIATIFWETKKFKSPLLLRQIVGQEACLHQAIVEGGLLIGLGWFAGLKPSDVVVIQHEGREKVKRVHKVRDGELYVLQVITVSDEH